MALGCTRGADPPEVPGSWGYGIAVFAFRSELAPRCISPQYLLWTYLEYSKVVTSLVLSLNRPLEGGVITRSLDR
jgi:hypothetical protein